MTKTPFVRMLWGSVFIVALLLLPLTASASKDGPCDGQVTIDGITYTPANDTPDDPVVVPDQPGLVASWRGTTGGVIKNHTGAVDMVIGPSSVTIADWGGENAEEDTEARGDYNVDTARNVLPFSVTGLYELRATHAGDGGDCSGNVMVLLEGNALSTPLGLTAVAGTVITAVGLVLAGRGRA